MISRIAKALRRHQAYNRTTRELSRLSDRELSDLGISRGQISAVARSAL